MADTTLFPIFLETERYVELLDDEQRSKLFMALYAYAKRGEELVTDDRLLLTNFRIMKDQIDRYYKAIDDKKEAGARGGRARVESAASSKVKQGQAESSKVKQGQAESSKVKQSQADSSKVKQGQADASTPQADSSSVKQTQADSSSVKQGQAESTSIPIHSNPIQSNPIQSNPEREGTSGKPSASRPARKAYGTYKNVFLSDEDRAKFLQERPSDADTLIEEMSCYLKSKGKAYKDYLAALRSWARREDERRPRTISLHPEEDRDPYSSGRDIHALDDTLVAVMEGRA